MHDPAALKKRICDTIEENKSAFIDLGHQILHEPETAFSEYKTAEKMENALSSLGLSCKTDLAITGLTADSPGRADCATVALIGELDAILLPNYPYADKATGAAHACGHNVQLGALYGAAIGLIKSGAMQALDGSVRFMAVPAEEGIEIGKREALINAGKIKAFNGKQEFIRLGLFDGVSAALMQHTSQGDKVSAGGPGGLCVVPIIIRYRGKVVHPVNAHAGVNALTAARIGLDAVDHMRDTMPGIYFHYTITECHGAVNVTPDLVTLEAHVRGWDIGCIKECNEIINRCLRAGAMAAGAEVEIHDFSGTLYFNEQEDLKRLVLENEATIFSPGHVNQGPALSTDANDVSCLLPTVHALVGGYNGMAHSKDLTLFDEHMCYVGAAKLLACTAAELLWNGAEKARLVQRNFKPVMTKQEYLKNWCNL